jgi:hypothetical protein
MTVGEGARSCAHCARTRDGSRNARDKCAMCGKGVWVEMRVERREGSGMGSREAARNAQRLGAITRVKFKSGKLTWRVVSGAVTAIVLDDQGGWETEGWVGRDGMGSR